MPAGQLSFAPVQAWGSTVGIDSYAILRPPSTSSAQQKYIAVYLGTGTLAQVGTYDLYQDAVTNCQTHFAALAT